MVNPSQYPDDETVQVKSLLDQRKKVRHEHFDTSAVEVAHELWEVWQRPEHLELVAIIDTNIGVGMPEQHRIHAAIAQIDILQPAINSPGAAQAFN